MKPKQTTRKQTNFCTDPESRCQFIVGRLISQFILTCLLFQFYSVYLELEVYNTKSRIVTLFLFCLCLFSLLLDNMLFFSWFPIIKKIPL